MDSAVTYLTRLKDHVYYLLVLKEREVSGENVHFAQHAIAMSERMIGAASRYPELNAHDGFSDAIDAVLFCAKDGVSLQHVRTHVLNTINDIDRLISKLGG